MRRELIRTVPLLVLGCWLLGRGWFRLARGRRERSARRRLGELLGAPGGTVGARSPAGRGTGRLRVVRARLRAVPTPVLASVAGGALCAGAFAGPAAALLTGLGGSLAARWWLRRSGGRTAAGEDREAAGQLPLAADLLAACASAGAGPGAAAEAVGRSLGGPLGGRLLRTAAELRLGGEPAEVWRRFGAIPGAEGLARCMERAGASGAPAAEAVARHAAGLRAASARTAAARAHRAQVLISAPVGLCFLPAFLAVGVAPVVIGLASGLLNG
ncbi:type II secretion system F family protein [Streptomyces termitum]